jgi:hypothetical protein
MKSTIFWDIMPCSPLEVNRHFGGTHSLRFQCRVSRIISSCSSFHTGVFFVLFDPKNVPPKRRMIFNRLHIVISRKIIFFNFTVLSRDSSVGIATGYVLDDRGVGVRVPVGSRIFSSPRHPDWLWGPPILPCIGYQGLFLWG